MKRAIPILLWSSLAVQASCTGDDADKTTEAATSPVAGCSGTGFSLFDQVCAVGDAAGLPAVHFRGQWFAIDYHGGDWQVTNAVAAQPSAVAPIDSTQDSRPGCIAQCPPDCPINPMEECQIGIYDACVARCDAYYTLQEARDFTWTVAGATYTIAASQNVEDQQVRGGQQDLRIASGLLFNVRVNDPVDGNPWTVIIHPTRAKDGDPDQVQVNTEVTEPGATTTTDKSGALFSTAQVNVHLEPNVELMSAVKTSAAGTTEMLALGNPVMSHTLDSVLPEGSSFQSQLVPQAIQAAGTVLSRVPGPGGAAGSYDMQRFSQFYMDTRRGQSGFSGTGTGERPLALTSPRDWRFRQNIVNYAVYFPFLAGICGFEAWVHAYIAGALTYGHTACFDGLAMNVDLSGTLEVVAKAGGGFGCNIVVASASAGLSAGVRAAAEFATSLRTDTVPPRVDASVNLYSQVEYDAYFKMRVLFWAKKWEQRVGATRIFQKSASYSLGAIRTEPGAQLCPGGGPPTTGTCDDPSASCDIEGRCIRYSFSGTDQPQRIDVGECTLPTCTDDPPLPADDTLTPFAPTPTTCFPRCGEYDHGLVTSDGLPASFNRELLAIPPGASVTILASTDGGQRARLYRWGSGAATRAVIDISGVTTGPSLYEDVKNSVNDFFRGTLSPTAQAVDLALNDLYSEGCLRQNVLIRGHSLGSLDTFRILESGVGAGNGILLGVPLHAIIHVNKDAFLRYQNPFPGSQVGIFVSPTDPIARGAGTANVWGHWNDVWCTAKKGPGPFFNQHLPDNIAFNVVDTPSQSGASFSGHYIGSYCAVAPVTCFHADATNRTTAVNLRASTGHYITAEAGGGGAVHANRTIAGPWEQLVLESIGPLRDGGQVYVRTDNGHFLTAPAGASGGLDASSEKHSVWTSFTVQRVGGPGDIHSGDSVALLSISRGTYVTAEGGGGSVVKADRAALGSWQTFQIVFR